MYLYIIFIILLLSTYYDILNCVKVYWMCLFCLLDEIVPTCKLGDVNSRKSGINYNAKDSYM